jgi:hypothetical protein
MSKLFRIFSKFGKIKELLEITKNLNYVAKIVWHCGLLLVIAYF